MRRPAERDYYAILGVPETAPDDEIRTSTPERLRAFESVEDLYA